MQLGLSSTKEGNEVKVCDRCALVLLISGTRHQRWKTGDMQSSSGNISGHSCEFSKTLIILLPFSHQII